MASVKPPHPQTKEVQDQTHSQGGLKPSHPCTNKQQRKETKEGRWSVGISMPQ